MNKSIDSPIVGVWAPVDGNPSETIAYRADCTVSMAIFGGLLHMEGSYSFVALDVIEINWYTASAEAENVVSAVNEKLDEEGVPTRVRSVQTSVLRVRVTGDELQTIHLEKGTVGHFKRVHSGVTVDT